MNKLTKAQFKALTNEVIKVCREYTNGTTETSSISFDKDYFSVWLHKDSKCICSVYFRQECWNDVKEFGIFYNATKHIPYGKYLTKIVDAYNEVDKTEQYFNY